MTLIRAFISIHVPSTSEAEDLRRDLRIAGLRPSPAEQTHITLRFIGDVDDSKVRKISECVERAVHGTGRFDVEVSGFGAFPNEERPSVLWMGVGPEDVLSGMSEGISSELRKAGIPFDPKPFKAHVTVARCRDRMDPSELFSKYSDKTFCRFQCSEVLVMRSVLGPKGATHTVLSRIPLGER